jgi:hypothetical protein
LLFVFLFKVLGSSFCVNTATVLAKVSRGYPIPLPTALAGNQYSGKGSAYWQSSDKYVLFATAVNGCHYPLTPDKYFPEGCQSPLTICVTYLPEGCRQPLTLLQQGCPNNIERSNLCAIPLKKVKFKVKTKRQQYFSLQKYRNFNLVQRHCSHSEQTVQSGNKRDNNKRRVTKKT